MPTKRSVLFITNSELGQASVILAVAYEVAILSEYDVNIASFAPLQGQVIALNENIDTKINWHTISGKSMKECLAANGLDFLPKHAPGVQGAVKAYKECLPHVIAPWTPEEYESVLSSCKELIKKLDPALVVIGKFIDQYPLFGQAADACTSLERAYMFLSPASFKDHIANEQPYQGILWKYSILASGHKYPVPWSTIPSNIYLALNLVFHGLLSSRVTSLEKWRSRNALPGGLSTIFSNFDPAILYLVPSTPSTDFPLTIPDNVHGCGPILPPIPLVPLSPTLNLPPTILFNLGSHTKYTSSETTAILSAFKILLTNHPTLCVTWKYQPADRHAEKHNMHIIAALPSQISSRITQISWFSDTPLSLLSQSSTVLSVHHGGANSFHEALAAGVPQVVCPRWLDTYEFARRAEWLGVGVMGNEKAAPDFEGAELAEAMEKVVGEEMGARFSRRAEKIREGLGGSAALEEGRKRAAELVMRSISGDK